MKLFLSTTLSLYILFISRLLYHLYVNCFELILTTYFLLLDGFQGSFGGDFLGSF